MQVVGRLLVAMMLAGTVAAPTPGAAQMSTAPAQSALVEGKRALAAELHTKGVDKDLITSVLGGINPAAERGRAEELVRRKLRRENLSDEAADARVTRRLMGMLARRGFSQSMAFDVVSVELAGERERRRV